MSDTILTKKEITKVRRILHLSLTNISEFTDEWTENLHKTFIQYSTLLTFLVYFSKNNGNEIYDATENYVEYQPDVFGWEKQMVAVEWSFDSKNFEVAILPVIKSITRANRERVSLFRDGASFLTEDK